MAAEVAFDVVDDRDLVALPHFNCDGARELADVGMVGLDAAVEDADLHALAGRPAPRPLTRDAPGHWSAARGTLPFPRRLHAERRSGAGSAIERCYAAPKV